MVSTVILQNIINEKIYLFLWFWFMFLFIVSIFYTFYRSVLCLCLVSRTMTNLLCRICTLFFEKLRFMLLFKTVSCGAMMTPECPVTPGPPQV